MPPGSHNAKLFINYRREDTAPYAGRLYDRLTAHFGADQVFIDIDQIEPGEDFVEVINGKVGACDIAIVSIGPNWLTATDSSGKRRLDDSEDFVRVEIIAALQRKIRVIPVLVGGARMPRKQDLPEELAPLSRRNAIELSETRFHTDVNRLIEAIEKPRSFPEKKKEPLPGPVVLVAEPAPPEKLSDPENLQETSALRSPAEEDAKRQRQLTEQKKKDQRDNAATHQRERADADAEKERLAAQQRAKEEEANKKEDSLKAAEAAPPEKLPHLENLQKTSALRPPAGPDALLKTLLGKRKNVLAAALVIGAVVAGVWWFGVQRPRRETERQLTEQKERDLKTVVAATNAQPSQPYENSLGMKFVPVPGTGVLFSIWETRVKDYKVFVEAKNREWPKPSFQQTEEDPAVNVTWNDATAFCEWLTEQERTAGRISANLGYRLPTDEEWSAAVGLEKEGESTPKERERLMNVKRVYPWGTQWPPPKGAGNYDPSLKVDDYENTSTAGSFEANRYGIHDLGGNVWEWCQDWYDAEKKYRVLRGASWNFDSPDGLLSSCRVRDAPEGRRGDVGFRCVLVVESSR